MAIESDHPVWKRTRQDHHGGALRNYLKPEDDDGYPRGPNASPRICRDCDAGSGYDSASPESVSWYVSSGDSSEDLEDNFFEKPDQSTFDMKGTIIALKTIYVVKFNQVCRTLSVGHNYMRVDLIEGQCIRLKCDQDLVNLNDADWSNSEIQKFDQ